ncbi:MAG: type II toxin-antitoxin system PemK/MazF family toxin [Nitrospirota bacterium]|nr:type II toxin-antitoxin system PemK/MazF family toxin [Nitrospirota bacterium]
MNVDSLWSCRRVVHLDNILSKFSTVICAPVYSSYDGLSTQMKIGIEEGLKHESSIHCDELVSIPKSALTHYVEALAPEKLQLLDYALQVALGVL